jgi:hypothetical protein
VNDDELLTITDGDDEPLTPETWISGLKRTRPHYFQRDRAGATGASVLSGGWRAEDLMQGNRSPNAMNRHRLFRLRAPQNWHYDLTGVARSQRVRWVQRHQLP